MSSLELWGGHECTINRIRNRYLDQSVLSGHDKRPSDLRLFAELGIKALRYPVLWEKVSPHRPDERDFRLADHRLNEIARLGMRPIVGLIHHGSGPRWTSLVDDEGFAPGLAAHARATAERYPWVQDWTPVNEPLTTARFSALYGIWYPHTANEGAFWRALLNQIDATRLSMREIRKVNPAARLIQTEDLGFCHATPPMRAQAEYENERRWITWDLLCGMVTPDHPLWARLASWGLEDRLRAIAEDPCPPDVLGLNHYLSSERLLDHRVELYPHSLRGGDGPSPYVNIEAVRTVAEGPIGIGTLLRQTWARYGRTVAITECHNGCTREEQMRWFWEVWRSAEAAKADGVDIPAVTAWALLGSFDWNRLLAEDAGHYELGVFDVSSGTPKPTAMVGLLKELASGRTPSHPVVRGAGWWRREDRLIAQAVALGEPCPKTPLAPLVTDGVRPLLLAGPEGHRMEALRSACDLRGLAYETFVVGACEESGLAERLDQVMEESRAWAVVNLSPGPDACRCMAETALRRGAPLATWGASSDAPSARTELVVLSDELISAPELQAFVSHVLDAVENGRPFRAASNRFAPAGFLPEAAHAVLDLLIDGVQGPVRLACAPAVSWAELAATVAHDAGLDAYLIEPMAIPRVGRASRTEPAPFVEAAERRLSPLTNAVRAILHLTTLQKAGRNACATEEPAEAGSAVRHAAE